jgi:hypothetical protein
MKYLKACSEYKLVRIALYLLVAVTCTVLLVAGNVIVLENLTEVQRTAFDGLIIAIINLLTAFLALILKKIKE